MLYKELQAGIAIRRRATVQAPSQISFRQLWRAPAVRADHSHDSRASLISRAWVWALLLAATLFLAPAAGAQSLASISGPVNSIQGVPLLDVVEWPLVIEHTVGTGTLTDMATTINLPPGWTYQGVLPGCSLTGTGPFTWTIGTMNSGETATCTLKARALPETLGLADGTAELTYDDSGTARSDSDKTEFQALNAIDLVITLDPSETELQPGESMTLQVIAQNFGNSSIISGGVASVFVELDHGPLSRTASSCTIVSDVARLGAVEPNTSEVCTLTLFAPLDINGQDIAITAIGTTPSPVPEVFPGDETDEIVVRAIAPLSLTVNTTNDSPDTNPGDGLCADISDQCSLRAAIMESNHWPAEDSIQIPAGEFELDVFIGSGDEDLGDLDVLQSVEIIGAGVARGSGGGTRILGLDNPDFGITSRVLEVPNAGGINLRLENLSIEHGSDTEGGGILLGAGNSLELVNVQFKNNDATDGEGGALLAYSEVTMTDVSFEDNTSSSHGGAVSWSAEDVTLTIHRGRFLDNRTQFGSTGAGGALSIPTTPGAKAVIKDTLFAFNRGHSGGAISTGVPTWVTNSTLSNNQASLRGGGLYTGINTVRFAFSTIVKNDAGLDSGQQFDSSVGEGGGIYLNDSFATVRLWHTVVSDNRARLVGSPLALPKSADCFGTLTSDGYAAVRLVNIDSECAVTAAAGDLPNMAYGLEPLDQVAGVHRFNDQSVLADSGTLGPCTWDADGDMSYTDEFYTDLAGNDRPQPAVRSGVTPSECDIGSFELPPAGPPETPLFSDGFESGDTSLWSE